MFRKPSCFKYPWEREKVKKNDEKLELALLEMVHSKEPYWQLVGYPPMVRG